MIFLSLVTFPLYSIDHDMMIKIDIGAEVSYPSMFGLLCLCANGAAIVYDSFDEFGSGSLLLKGLAETFGTWMTEILV